MKVIIIGKFLNVKRMSTELFITRAFEELKWTILTHEINSRMPMLFNNFYLLYKAIRHKPEVILITKAFGIYPETISIIKMLIKTKIIGWWPDPVVEHDGRIWDKVLVTLYKPYDLYAQTTGWPDHLKKLENLGIKKAVFVPQGCDTQVHRKMALSEQEAQQYGSDVVFVGMFYEGDRGRLLRAVWENSDQGKKYSVKYWGGTAFPPELPHAGTNAFGDVMAKIYTASKICLHTNSNNTVPLYFSDRYYISMACGIFTLVQYVPGLEELFENHKQLVWFNDEKEACEIIEYYLAHEEERIAIAVAGMRKTWSEDTYTDRIKTLLAHVNIQ